jgi:spore germination protein GerM
MTASSAIEDEFLEFFDEESVEIAIEQQTLPERQPVPPPEPEIRPQEPVSEQPPETQPPVTQPTVTQPTVTQPTVTQPVQPSQEIQTQPPPPDTPPVQTRDRVVYFTQVNNDGQILQSRVTRRLPVTQSPMLDALNVILAGPSAEELNRGILNLIPQNTRILSAAIRGTTAYVNFSEDFLFNTFGVEGYIAQLRQIVWTVTEFSNVNDVQILIEGRRMDYLGEGIWIGSPISRQSF